MSQSETRVLETAAGPGVLGEIDDAAVDRRLHAIGHRQGAVAADGAEPAGQ